MGHADQQHQHDHDDPNLDRGLAFDMGTMLERRRALKLLAGAGLLAVAGCGSPTSSTTASTTTSAGAAPTTAGTSPSTTTSSVAGTSTTASGATPARIPQETEGPFPGDGSNGPDVLTQSGVVRRDIRSSFGSSTTTAPGVPLTVDLRLLDSVKHTALAGAAVYVWHCDRDGRYSMYSEGATQENYLRGVQEADRDGRLSFQTIFPGAYPGRWPHIHFEVYPSLAAATTGGRTSTISQLALPEDTCKLVYATDGYTSSIRNLAQTSLSRDMVFSDGWTLEMPTVTGTVTSGLTAGIDVGI